MLNYRARPRWTLRQTTYLEQNCYSMKDEDIATALGKSLKSIRRKRENMELKKACGRGMVEKQEKPFVRGKVDKLEVPEKPEQLP